MDEREMESFLHELLLEASEIEREPIASILRNDEAGLLTRDKGLVVRLADGSEFQITIIQSR